MGVGFTESRVKDAFEASKKKVAEIVLTINILKIKFPGRNPGESNHFLMSTFDDFNVHF